MADRYESAAGWNPRKKDPYKRERKLAAILFPDLTPTPFERRDASPIALHPKAPLFGGLWRRGELAVLLGEPGTSKSILTAQIAETIALAQKPDREGGLNAPPVLLLDLEHTAAQIAERYSVKPLANDGRRIHYEFSDRLDWRTITPDLQVPAAFNGDLVRYFRHWVYDAVAWADPHAVIVIDSLSRIAKPYEMRDVLLKLKHQAAANAHSVLVVAHARAKKRPSPITLADFAAPPEALSAADTVFAIARSYLGPDIRYIKQLSSKSAPLQYDSDSVLLSVLGRTESPAAPPNTPEDGWPNAFRTSGLLGGPRVSSPHVSKGSTLPVVTSINSDALTAVHRSTFEIRNSQIENPFPFLGLTFLFTAPEHDLLHPPKIEKPLRPKSSKQALVEAMTDGSYARYLSR